MTARPLRLDPPPDRGRLLSADQVASDLFYGHVTAAWVKRNVRAGRFRVGHRTIAWFEHDVRAWIASHRQEDVA